MFPQGTSERVLEACQQDDRRIGAASQQVVDGGPVDVGKFGDNNAVQHDFVVETASEPDGLCNADGGVTSNVTGEEITGHIVPGRAHRGTAARHDETSVAVGDTGSLVGLNLHPAAGVGSNLHAVEWGLAVDREVGRRIHQVIGQLAGTSPSPREVIAVVHRLWREDPHGGTVATSTRLQCSTAVSVYLQRCHPDRKLWSLHGVEVAFDEAVADLVWEHTDGRIMVDEVKSTNPELDDVADQLRRLARGGRQHFGASFAGVRFVPVAAPGRVRVYDERNDELVAVRFPAGSRPR